MYELTQKQWEALQKKSDKLQDKLLALVPVNKRKEANKALLSIVDMEIELEANCNK